MRYLRSPNNLTERAQFERLAEQVAAGPPSLRPAAVRSYLDLAGASGAQPGLAMRYVVKAIALLTPATRLQNLDLTDALPGLNAYKRADGFAKQIRLSQSGVG